MDGRSGDAVVRWGLVALAAAGILGVYTRLPLFSLALQAAVFALGAYWLARARSGAKDPWLGWASLATAVVLATSTLFSLDRASSLGALVQWISYLMAGWLAASTFRPTHLPLMAQYLLLLGVLMAGVAVYFYWGESGNVALPVMNSILGNKNHFGGYLLLVLPLALALYLRAPSRRERLSYGAVAVFLGSAFILTYSRGAWFAFVPALALVAWVFRRHPAALLRRLVLVGLAAVLAAFLISQGTLGRTLDLGYQGALSVARAAVGGEAEGTLAPRLDYWQGAIRIMVDHLATGSGLGTFGHLFPSYQHDPQFYSRFAHNFFLQMGAEAGVPALLASLALFGVLAMGWARPFMAGPAGSGRRWRRPTESEEGGCLPTESGSPVCRPTESGGRGGRPAESGSPACRPAESEEGGCRPTESGSPVCRPTGSGGSGCRPEGRAWGLGGWCRDGGQRALSAGLAAGLIASTLHNLVELDWYIPAIGILFALEAGLYLASDRAKWLENPPEELAPQGIVGATRRVAPAATEDHAPLSDTGAPHSGGQGFPLLEPWERRGERLCRSEPYPNQRSGGRPCLPEAAPDERGGGQPGPPGVAPDQGSGGRPCPPGEGGAATPTDPTSRPKEADLFSGHLDPKWRWAGLTASILLLALASWQWAGQFLLAQADPAQDPAGAQALLERAAALNPLDGEPRFRLAELHLARSEAAGREAELEQGITEAREALSLSPARDDYRILLARLHLSAGQTDRAVPQLKSLTDRLHPLQAPDAYRQLGEAYLRQGRTQEARALYQRLLAGFPQGPNTLQPPQPGALIQQESAGLLAEAHLALGNIYTGEGQSERAREEYLASLALNPDSAPASFNLGVIEYSQQRWPEALAHFQWAARLDPSYAPASYFRGLAHLQLGQREEAAADFRAALEVDPGYEAARRALEGLR